MKHITSSKSITGLRESNQDSCLGFSYRQVHALLVADGNGGEGGDKIAQTTVKTIVGEMYYHLYRQKYITPKTVCKIGLAAIETAAKRIEMLKKEFPLLNSCGSTVTLMIVLKNTIIALWVGDSPGIICKDEQLTRLTNPQHTLSELLIAQGSSRESIEQQSGLSSVLTRCLGHSDCKPDYKVIKLSPPFYVIAASDGINALPQSKLLEIIRSTRLTKSLPDRIIAASLAYGSEDNISVSLTKVCEDNRLARRKLKYV